MCVCISIHVNAKQFSQTESNTFKNTYSIEKIDYKQTVSFGSTLLFGHLSVLSCSGRITGTHDNMSVSSRNVIRVMVMLIVCNGCSARCYPAAPDNFSVPMILLTHSNNSTYMLFK